MVSNKLEKESVFAGTKDGRPWSSFMFPNGHNIKWIQLQSKYGICPKLGALGKYFQFISMNKSIAKLKLSFCKNRFFNPKKKTIMNKSSSLLLHLHLYLLHFFKMNKSSYFKKRKKKRRRKFSKRVLGLGALGSYFLGFFQKKKKKIQNFQFLEKIQDF